MQKLRVLVLNGNKDLHVLPPQLATCESLADISLDAEHFSEPPPNIIALGSLEILRYLLTGEEAAEVLGANYNELTTVTQDFIRIERGLSECERNFVSNDTKSAREKAFLDHERDQNEKYNRMDALFYQQNQKRKQELLRSLLQEQNETDELLKNVQKVRDVERTRLITNILKEEHNAEIIVVQLLSLKNGPDADLLEYERVEDERLLEKLRIDHEELRRRDILNAMSEVLEAEAQQILTYHEQRDATVKLLLEQEKDLNIENILKNNDRNRQMAMVADNEEWQKIVVGTFIEQNDARTWGLVEQVRLVETQLAAMTKCEIDRKRCELDGRVVSNR